MLRTVTATRYIAPFRQGGSVPALIEADDESLYVLKFLGAAQGAKALIAELVAGEIGRALGLSVPELVFILVEPGLGEAEPHAEIRDRLNASVGINLGLRWLPYALEYNPVLKPAPSAAEASAIVWFDAYVTNVDRTPRNINILLQSRRLWLIDHGASLYFHHDWRDAPARSRSPFPLIREHALLRFAAALAQADSDARARLAPQVIDAITALIPGDWLQSGTPFSGPAEARQAYAAWLKARLDAAPIFVEEAERARTQRL